MNYFLPAIVAKSLPVFIAVSVNFLPYLPLKFVPVFIAVLLNRNYYKSVGTNWLALCINGNNLTNIDGF